MIDPVYTTTLIIGGSTHKYAFTALPSEILADQSMDLSVTVTKADNSPYDLTGATAEFFCTARNVSDLAPTPLGSATLSDSGSGTVDTVSIVLPKDGIPDFLGEYSPTRTGSSVFYFQIQDADSYIQIYQYTNVTASDFSGNGSGNIELPASSLLYTPADGADWVDPDPTTVEEGLDGLAERVQDIEDNPATGDMTKAVYDPQAIEADAFDRNNMTGTQLASTISDFETAIANSPSVTGSVTVHTDVSDAGAGIIPSSQTNIDIVNNTAHVSSSSNPHNVTPAQVQNDQAIWNANQIHDLDLPVPQGATDDDKVLTYSDATTSWVLATQAGAGSGENNDLSLSGSATGESIRESKSGSDIIIKGILGANNAGVSTIGSDVVIDVVDSAENVRGAIAIASSATIATGTDDTQAVTPVKLSNALSNYQGKTADIKTTTGVYTLLSADETRDLFIDDVLTIPVLTAGYSVTVRNDSATATGFTLSGVTSPNNSDTQISAYGTIVVFYQDSTTVWIDGNTEA